MIKLKTVKRNKFLKNYYKNLIDNYKFKKILVIFDILDDFNEYQLRNNEYKILIDTPFYNDNNYYKFYINNSNYNKQNLLVINSNEISIFENTFNLKYSKEWCINKQGCILILLSHSKGWHRKYLIMKFNNIIELIKNIRKTSNKQIIIKLHRKDYKYINKKSRKFFKKYNCILFGKEKLDLEIHNIYCIISDMTFYAFKFAFSGIPLFNFSNNKQTLNKLPIKDIVLTKYNMLNSDNIDFKNIMNRDDFFNKLLTYHFNIQNDDLLNKLEPILR
jgi:hypothetical protein